MRAIKIIITTVFLFQIVISSSQQTQQNINIKIDAIGNAQLEISMTMNAQQWQMWTTNLGNNPAALKREIEKSMPAYFLDDFKLGKDDMNRSFSLKLNAYGLCKINKKGKWSIDTDQKNAQITKIDDHKYLLNSSPMEFGGQIQQTYVIDFPEEANSIEVEKDAYGQTVFEFKMDNSSTDINYMRWSGIVLLVMGGGVFGFQKKQKTMK